jgi:hypothetical protein
MTTGKLSNGSIEIDIHKEDKMNKGRLIWGIICLALAALLGALNLTLDSDQMMFLVDNVNMPWVPVVVLGALGLWLLVTAGRVEEKKEIVIDEDKAALNKRFETVGWGLFLIMLGGSIFVPEEFANKGLWSIGMGVIFLGLNAARYLNDMKMSSFTTILGVLSLASGIAQLFGLKFLGDWGLVIILGAYLLLRPWFEKQQVFGKAEEA